MKGLTTRLPEIRRFPRRRPGKSRAAEGGRGRGGSALACWCYSCHKRGALSCLLAKRTGASGQEGSQGEGKVGLPGVEECWYGLGSAKVGSGGLGSDGEERGGLSGWRDVGCMEMLGLMACWLRWACVPWSEEGIRVNSGCSGVRRR